MVDHNMAAETNTFCSLRRAERGGHREEAAISITLLESSDAQAFCCAHASLLVVKDYEVLLVALQEVK